MRWTFRGIMLLAIITVGACNQSKLETVVILDLDAVARAVGEDQRIMAETKRHSDTATTRLDALAQRLDAEIIAQRKELGDTADDEASTTLSQFTSRRQAQYQDQQRQAQQALEAYRAELIERFRQQIKPLAEAVARDRGAQVILLPQQALFWFDGGADITGEVITAYRRQPHTAKPDDASNNSPPAS